MHKKTAEVMRKFPDGPFVEIDGTLYDFEVGQVDEVFDGFDTVYPACFKLVPKID